MTACPSDAQSEIDALLNTITDATIMRDEFRARLLAALHATRKAALEEGARHLEEQAGVSRLRGFSGSATVKRICAAHLRALAVKEGE